MITLILPRDDPALVTTGTAPLLEAALSLHVLTDAPSHALQHPWVRASRAIPPSLRRDLHELDWVWWDALPDCLLPAPGAHLTVEQDVARLRALAPEEAAYVLGRPLFFYGEADAGGPDALQRPEVRERALDLAGRIGARCLESAALVFDDPAALRDRVASALEAYCEAAFAEEWERLSPALHEACALVDAQASDVWPLLEAARGALTVDREARTITRRSPHEHTVEASAERPIVLVPSVYGWPHARVNCDGPWPLAIIFPPPAVVAAGQLEPVPDPLVAGLRALADPTRLRLLRLLARRERSPEELAPLVRMGQPGVSRHLRTLAEVGLVTSRRDGWYVLYSAEPAAIEALLREAEGFAQPDEDGSQGLV